MHHAIVVGVKPYLMKILSRVLPGAEGALYMQRYHTAHVSGEGEPDGHGSFRCLTTKASRAQSD